MALPLPLGMTLPLPLGMAFSLPLGVALPLHLGVAHELVCSSSLSLHLYLLPAFPSNILVPLCLQRCA